MSRSRLTSVLLATLVMTGTFAGIPALGLKGLPNDPFTGTEWPGPLAGRATASGTPLLWLRAGTFDPIEDQVPTILGLDGTSSLGVYLVQFNGPISPDLGSRLRSAGGSVLGFVPEDGLVVAFQRPTQVASVAMWKDVRWLGPWLDGWKIDPSLTGLGGRVTLSIATWRSGTSIDGGLAAVDGRVLSHLLDTYVADVPARAVPLLARMGAVSWIEPWSPPVLMMDNAARSIGARQGTDGPLDTEGTAVWSYVGSLDEFDGITGNGVLVDVTDTGVDGSHDAFAGRLKAFSAIEPGRLAWTDPVGHGTHVAGIVLGDGSYREEEDQYYHDNFDGKYAGVAPGATLLASSLYGPGINFTYRNITKWSVQQGADISQNSWGSYPSYWWGNYTIVSRDYDNSTRDADWTTPGNQSLLVVFAAGNAGYSGNNTLSTTAVAKNVIAVGATGNGKNVTPEMDVWLYSSRGWTDDGRIKPDLVAPGDAVVSTWGLEDNGSTGDLPPDAAGHSYITYGGTSMAAPMVSGSAALVIEHLRTVEKLADPSPAVVKAILLASADHLPSYAWPSREQGWGRLNVSRAIVETRDSNTEFIDQTTKLYDTGESMTYRYDVQSGMPLRIALVWTDLPSQAYVGKTLVNDLDMEVRSPSGTVYKGNWFQGGASVTGGTADRSNNVEMVYLDDPEAGEWRVTVSCAELPPLEGGGNQDFAIAVVGNVNKKFVDLAAQNLSVRPIDAAEGDVLNVSFDIANLGNLPAPQVPWVCDVIGEGGILVERIGQGILDLTPRGGQRIYTSWTAVRGSYTIRVTPNPLLTISEESYQNNEKTRSVFIKGFGVSAEVPEPYLDGPPGEDVTFSIEVTNTGNVPDLFLLSRSEPPTGWSAHLDVSFLDIGAGKTKSAHLVVSVPDGLMAGGVANVTVTVVSQGNGTHLAELFTQTVVGDVLKVEMDLEKPSQEGVPGEEVMYTFGILNTGNTVDTYRVSYNQRSGPTLGVTFDLPRSTFTAEVGETVSGNLTIALDEARVANLPVGAKVAFDIKVESVVNGSVSVTVPCVLNIGQLHKITIPTPSSETFYGTPGDEVDVVLEFVNEGNGADTVTPVLQVPEGWEWRSAEPFIYLEQGETKTVQMWATVADVARAGLYTVSALGKVGEESMDTVELSFQVDRVPGIWVRLDGSYDRKVTQGDEITLEFRVTNTGNDVDIVWVEFSGLTPGIDAEARPPSRELDIGDVGTIIVAFNASLGADVVEGAYNVVFVYAGVERFTVQLNVTVEEREVTPGPSTNGGEDDGGISMLLVGAIVLIIIVVVVALALVTFAKRRREAAMLEETFFKGQREDRAAAEILREEMATRRAPPPPPETPVASEWEESIAVTPAPVPEVEGPPPRSGACPECGNAMQPIGPGQTGMYCPMCGHTEGGG